MVIAIGHLLDGGNEGLVVTLALEFNEQGLSAALGDGIGLFFGRGFGDALGVVTQLLQIVDQVVLVVDRGGRGH
ncbi:MAG: hypothetical protein H7A19_07835 [Rhodanobacteraceae bacterium]|nr:hypothetical protein [Rhodanobacteraceae bacterium]MCP5474740.1 hypothetical protein [Rhodanobacteraceae bacterium]